MTKRLKRVYTRRQPAKKDTTPFVVYVTFPSGGKEYVYLCNDPSVKVGSTVIANGTAVRVNRISAFDSFATKFVRTEAEYARAERKKSIIDRLSTLEREHIQHARWKAMAKASPEARRLLKELESL